MSEVRGFRGLWTSPDDLNAPEGSLAVADNVAFYRPGVLEPFRGTELLSVAGIGNTINRAHEYQGTLIAHWGTNSISRWTGSAWVQYSGTFDPPDSSTPVKFFEGEGSLFVLTAAGAYELDSPAGTWRLTGSPLGLQGTAALRRASNETGFAPANGQWAYRLAWGYKNASRRLQLGAPSGRFVVVNPATFVGAKANIDKPTGGAKTVRVQNTTHGLATGEYIDVTLGGTEANYTAGRYQVTVVSSTQFTYVDAGANGVVGNPTNNITFGFTSRNADVVAPIPAGITTSHFLQVYRSAQSADANTEPSDNLALVYERSPTNLEVAAGSMTVTDIAPDALRGAGLYTSVGTLLDAKAQPPVAHDACLFKDTAFYANVAGVQSLQLQIISLGATTLASGARVQVTEVPNGDINASNWGYAISAAAVENLAINDFQVYTNGSVAQNIANTAKSFVRVLNNYDGNTHVYAEYVSSDTEAPGQIRFYGRSPTVKAFTVFTFNSTTAGRGFAPEVAIWIPITDIARAGTTVTVNTALAHGFVTGQSVELIRSSSVAFPNGVKTIAVVDSDTFTYTEAGSTVAAGSNFGSFASQPSTQVLSTNSAIASAFMWSAPGEPWAVPAINVKDIGKGTILACVATRDRVLLETDDGFYQVTGDGTNWSLSEFDTTLKLHARRATTSAGGRVYALTDQGVVEAMESARLVSLPVDRDLRTLLASALSTVQARAFMVAYETQRQVWLFLPAAAGNTSARRAYVYNVDTGDWTRRVLDPDSPTSPGTPFGPVANDAFVSPTDGKLYLASGQWVAKERKSLSGVADQLEAVMPTTIFATVADILTATALKIDTFGSSLGQYFPAGSIIYNANTNQADTVTGVDGASHLVFVADTSLYTLGDDVRPTVGPISSVVEPVAQTEGDPGAQKIFAEGSLAFRDSRFASASLQFATDLSPSLSAATTLIPPGGATPEPAEIDFWVPQPWRRGARLRMRFTHLASLERYALQSFTLLARPCSPRTTR